MRQHPVYRPGCGGERQQAPENHGWSKRKGGKVLGVVNNATDEDSYNTYGCSANNAGTYGTPSFIRRCSGNPMDQRLYTVQFMVKI